MSLTAKTGFCASRGMAFFMLLALGKLAVRVVIAYEAYAPRPMVLDTIRKGRSFGIGSS